MAAKGRYSQEVRERAVWGWGEALDRTDALLRQWPAAVVSFLAVAALLGIVMLARP